MCAPSVVEMFHLTFGFEVSIYFTESRISIFSELTIHPHIPISMLFNGNSLFILTARALGILTDK